LPNKIIFPEIRVADFKNKRPFEVLIGMDIIGQGDLAITDDGSVKFVSYRKPHGTPYIDWENYRKEPQ
jgi:hypothetical protein